MRFSITGLPACDSPVLKMLNHQNTDIHGGRFITKGHTYTMKSSRVMNELMEALEAAADFTFCTNKAQPLHERQELVS